jgi:long-subunit fatty acid transport protein
MTLDRFRGSADNPDLDFSLSGINAASFRVGAQWTAIEDDEGATGATRNSLQLGAGYRHRTVVEVSNDSGRAIFMDFTDLESTFTLPGKINFGVRWDYQRAGVVADFEYTLNGQNQASTLSGFPAGATDRLEVANVFAWQDAITLRGGFEYRLMDEGQLAVRAGYAFDGQTANASYPTAFGTPPAPTHVITAGVGYESGDWELNVAGAYRTGGAEVSQADLDAGDLDCLFCSQPGTYRISLAGVYLDFSYDFD